MEPGMGTRLERGRYDTRKHPTRKQANSHFGEAVTLLRNHKKINALPTLKRVKAP